LGAAVTKYDIPRLTINTWAEGSTDRKDTIDFLSSASLPMADKLLSF